MIFPTSESRSHPRQDHRTTETTAPPLLDEQVRRIDRCCRPAENGGALDDVLELTHIPGPRMRREHCERVGCEPSNQRRVIAVRLRQEIPRKDLHVAAALSQRRDVHAQHVQTIEQVDTEKSVVDGILDRDIRRGDDATIDRHFLRCASRRMRRSSSTRSSFA